MAALLAYDDRVNLEVNGVSRYFDQEIINAASKALDGIQALSKLVKKEREPNEAQYELLEIHIEETLELCKTIKTEKVGENNHFRMASQLWFKLEEFPALVADTVGYEMQEIASDELRGKPNKYQPIIAQLGESYFELQQHLGLATHKENAANTYSKMTKVLYSVGGASAVAAVAIFNATYESFWSRSSGGDTTGLLALGAALVTALCGVTLAYRPEIRDGNFDQLNALKGELAGDAKAK